MDLAAYGAARNYQSSGSVSPERLVDPYQVQGIPREEMLNLASRLIEETMSIGGRRPRPILRSFRALRRKRGLGGLTSLEWG